MTLEVLVIGAIRRGLCGVERSRKGGRVCVCVCVCVGKDDYRVVVLEEKKRRMKGSSRQGS